MSDLQILISILKFTHILQNVGFYVSLQDTGALREIHFTEVGNVNLMAQISGTLPCEHYFEEIIVLSVESSSWGGGGVLGPSV